MKKNTNREPDWVLVREHDQKKFFGYNNSKGKTDWYDENGELDTSSFTPQSEDDYLERCE